MKQTNLDEYLQTEYDLWRKEVGILAIIDFENEHFKNIVNVGKDAAPFLIKLLEEGPNQVVYACDLIFPDEVTYKGYCPLDFVCNVWLTILKLKYNEISEQENNS